jgi:hypothetical protein
MIVLLCFSVAIASAFILGAVGGYVSGRENERVRWKQYSDKVNKAVEDLMVHVESRDTGQKVINQILSNFQAALYAIAPRPSKPEKFKHGSN